MLKNKFTALVLGVALIGGVSATSDADKLTAAVEAWNTCVKTKVGSACNDATAIKAAVDLANGTANFGIASLLALSGDSFIAAGKCAAAIGNGVNSCATQKSVVKANESAPNAVSIKVKSFWGK